MLAAAAAAAVVAAIATGGASIILAGALIGATVGAGVATAAIAVSDYQSGNVRSWGDAAFGIAGGALFGAVAGAAVAAAPFAAEFYTPLINVQLAMWGIEGANIGIGVVTTGLFGITGLNALFTGNNIAAMNSGHDFLGSTIFRDHPDIYMGAQIITAFASMNILGTGLAVAASERNQGASETGSGLNRTVHAGKQGKHIVGHNNYVAGRSVFQGTIEDAQKLIDKFSGTGEWIGETKERINFGFVIGQYVDPASGEAIDTTVGIIHYSNSGAHIVPAQPIK